MRKGGEGEGGEEEEEEEGGGVEVTAAKLIGFLLCFPALSNAVLVCQWNG